MIEMWILLIHFTGARPETLRVDFSSQDACVTALQEISALHTADGPDDLNKPYRQRNSLDWGTCVRNYVRVMK